MRPLARLGRLLAASCLGTVVVASVSCGPKLPTPAEAIAACHADPTSKCCGNVNCLSSEVCDFTLVCDETPTHEFACSPATGDRQCHKRCAKDVDCGQGQACQTTTLFLASDQGFSVSFCVTP